MLKADKYHMCLFLECNVLALETKLWERLSSVIDAPVIWLWNVALGRVLELTSAHEKLIIF